MYIHIHCAALRYHFMYVPTYVLKEWANVFYEYRPNVFGRKVVDKHFSTFGRVSASKSRIGCQIHFAWLLSHSFLTGRNKICKTFAKILAFSFFCNSFNQKLSLLTFYFIHWFQCCGILKWIRAFSISPKNSSNFCLHFFISFKLARRIL
jgi:hypothetical protein